MNIFCLLFTTAILSFGILCSVRYLKSGERGRKRIAAVVVALAWPFLYNCLALLLIFVLSSVARSTIVESQTLASKLPKREKPEVSNAKAQAGFSLSGAAYSLAALSTVICLLSLGLPGLLDFEKDKGHSVVLDDGQDKFKRVLEMMHGKHPIFKNSVRGWIHFQALYIFNWVVLYLTTGTLILIWIANFLGHHVTVGSILEKLVLERVIIGTPLAALSLWYVIYQRVLADAASKWKYCADLYNDVFKDSECKKGDVSAARVALAIDILTLDLWAKRSFAREFQQVLQYAIHQQFEPDRAKVLFQDLEDRKMTEAVAEDILESQLKSLRPPPPSPAVKFA